jgi:hypothetical protein
VPQNIKDQYRHPLPGYAQDSNLRSTIQTSKNDGSNEEFIAQLVSLQTSVLRHQNKELDMKKKALPKKVDNPQKTEETTAKGDEESSSEVDMGVDMAPSACIADKEEPRAPSPAPSDDTASNCR